ncbi:MAG: hypothetical protein OEW21_15535 [Betaproteobacteria bacterium]|nr:hypothetical protein [Betaproteobacteria bacterium]
MAHAEGGEGGWISGFSITPGFGMRSFSLDVVRKSDGLKGNLSNDVPRSFFAALRIDSPTYQFGDSPWGADLPPASRTSLK